MLYVSGIAAAEITFRKTEIIDRIKQVGFAGTVASADAHYLVGKNKLLERIVLKLKQRYGLQGKGQGVGGWLIG